MVVKKCQSKNPALCVDPNCPEKKNFSSNVPNDLKAMMKEVKQSLKSTFGKKKVAPVKDVQETSYMSVSDEKIDAIKAILVTVGLDEEDRYDFAYKVKNKSSYSGGSFEWTIPETGVRFWVHGWGETGRITKVKVSDHNGRTRFTPEQFDEANRKLAELFV